MVHMKAADRRRKEGKEVVDGKRCRKKGKEEEGENREKVLEKEGRCMRNVSWHETRTPNTPNIKWIREHK